MLETCDCTVRREMNIRGWDDELAADLSALAGLFVSCVGGQRGARGRAHRGPAPQLSGEMAEYLAAQAVLIGSRRRFLWMRLP
jgi:hypothetical protein